jgi:hypothetical protein
MKFNLISNINQSGGIITEQQYTELHKVFNNTQIKYIDGKITYHINGSVQILILSHNFDLKTNAATSEQYSASSSIATEAVLAYTNRNKLKPPRPSYSLVYCKLIWRALKKSRLMYTNLIPDEWSLPLDFYDPFADKLLEIKGWDIYALSILLRKEPIPGITNLFSEANFKIANDIDNFKIKIMNEQERNTTMVSTKLIQSLEAIYDCLIIHSATNTNDILFFFEGRTSSFGSIKKISPFNGTIVHIRDTSSTWYDKMNIKITLLIDVMSKSSADKKLYFMGGSMGGYAALYHSGMYDRSVCIAFSPQTINLSELTTHYPTRVLTTGNNIETLKTRLLDRSNNYNKGCRYIIIGKSECELNQSWGDQFMAGSLARTINTKILIVNQDTHLTFKYFDFAKNMPLIQANNVRLLNCDTGIAYLKSLELYYPKKANVLAVESEPRAVNRLDLLSPFFISDLNSTANNNVLIKRSNVSKWICFFSDTNDFKYLPKFKSDDYNLLYLRNMPRRLHNLTILTGILDKEQYLKSATEIYFIGENYSAYAAFYLSCYFNNSICLSFNPVTFPTFNLVSQSDAVINITSDITSYVPENFGIIDLKNLNQTQIASGINSQKYIVSSVSQCMNSMNYYNATMIHAGYLVGEPNVNILIYPLHQINLLDILNFDSLLKFIHLPKDQQSKDSLLTNLIFV